MADILPSGEEAKAVEMVCAPRAPKATPKPRKRRK